MKNCAHILVLLGLAGFLALAISGLPFSRDVARKSSINSHIDMTLNTAKIAVSSDASLVKQFEDDKHAIQENIWRYVDDVRWSNNWAAVTCLISFFCNIVMGIIILTLLGGKRNKA